MKVKLKSLDKLRNFARHTGGDMSETLGYYVRFDGSLIPNDATLNDESGFHAVFKHVLENGEEVLVVDHPNIITKREYEQTKELYEKVEENRSTKGVY